MAKLGNVCSCYDRSRLLDFPTVDWLISDCFGISFHPFSSGRGYSYSIIITLFLLVWIQISIHPIYGSSCFFLLGCRGTSAYLQQSHWTGHQPIRYLICIKWSFLNPFFLRVWIEQITINSWYHEALSVASRLNIISITTEISLNSDSSEKLW